MKRSIRLLQLILAIWYFIGAVYVLINHADLASDWALETFPTIFWTILGAVQIVFALGLLISIRNIKRKRLAIPSALGLAVISILGLFIYSAYAGFPGVLWSLIPTTMLLYIAYKRRV